MRSIESARRAGARVHAAFTEPQTNSPAEQTRLAEVREVGWSWMARGLAFTLTTALWAFLAWGATVLLGWPAILLVIVAIDNARKMIWAYIQAWGHLTFNPAEQVREGIVQADGSVLFF